MKITKIAEQIGSITRKDQDREKLLTICEAHVIWETLIAKYDDLHLTNILLIFAKDEDFKIILQDGIEALKKQIDILEKLTDTYNIPLPKRPPDHVNHSNVDINIFEDTTIFRTIHCGMQGSLILLMDGFKHAVSATIREAFRKALNIEMDLYDAFTDYGKMKGFLVSGPTFRP
ncbi:MAG: DUF3231 family protein [Clostridia bacterium]|nr:DUF3231 family protein [Clostridia bacterium]